MPLTTLLMNALPDSIQTLAEVIGESAALTLVRAWPPTTSSTTGRHRVIVYVPSTLPDQHRLIDILGYDVAQRLVAHLQPSLAPRCGVFHRLRAVRPGGAKTRALPHRQHQRRRIARKDFDAALQRHGQAGFLFQPHHAARARAADLPVRRMHRKHPGKPCARLHHQRPFQQPHVARVRREI
ncbi:hypothetical protein G6F31_017329 [Rhizopus arrhizus]|nr:hypothetical protein G6F31_017329 [Rhizopus arrhizus]